MVTEQQLTVIVGGQPTAAQLSNIRSMVTALEAHAPRVGLDQLHRLAHFLPQACHESGGFRYDRELWGPTPAQLRYDTRTDLGNTPEADGDGYKNRGRGPFQLTGAYNIGKFYDWCRAEKLNPPDFRTNPDLINTDPWEGLSAIWYWEFGNPSGKSLNRYADENNIIQITKLINGGLNGFDDRVRYYVRTSLVLLGWAPSDVAGFQKWAQSLGYLPADTADRKQVDGDAGPLTMAALHRALAAQSAANDVKASPVVEVETEQVEVPVVVKGSDKSGFNWLMGAVGIFSPAISAFADLDLPTKLVFGGIGILAIVLLLWRGELIARRIKAVVAEFGS